VRRGREGGRKGGRGGRPSYSLLHAPRLTRKERASVMLTHSFEIRFRFSAVRRAKGSMVAPLSWREGRREGGFEMGRPHGSLFLFLCQLPID